MRKSVQVKKISDILGDWFWYDTDFKEAGNNHYNFLKCSLQLVTKYKFNENFKVNK